MSTAQLQQKRNSAHCGVFFRSWIRDPFHVASIVPSGRWLAKLMATGLEPGARVVELGAGTGTLTEAILDRGVLPEDLTSWNNIPNSSECSASAFPARPWCKPTPLRCRGISARCAARSIT